MKKHILQILAFCIIGTSCNETIVIDDVPKENNQAKREFYEQQMKNKGFSLEINGACDDALEDTLHERSVAYIDTLMISGKGKIVEFKFKEACCQQFLGDYEVNNDTLMFELEQINDVVCTCICWYRYKLNLRDIRENFSVLEINVK